MFTLLNIESVEEIFFDLTGDTRFEYDTKFINAIKKLSENYYVHISSVDWASKELENINSCYAKYESLDLPRDAYKRLSNPDSSECKFLVVTNNVENIVKWQNISFSVVYLTKDWLKCDEIDIKSLPDQFWTTEFLYEFADDKDISIMLNNEYIGIPVKDSYYFNNIYTKFSPKFLTDKTLNINIYVTGRYFASSDVRAYAHPLSQAILAFKKDNPTAQRILTLFYLQNIAHLQESGEFIDLVTCIPPRPGKNNRFDTIKENIEIFRTQVFFALFFIKTALILLNISKKCGNSLLY